MFIFLRVYLCIQTFSENALNLRVGIFIKFASSWYLSGEKMLRCNEDGVCNGRSDYGRQARYHSVGAIESRIRAEDIEIAWSVGGAGGIDVGS